MFRLLDDCPIVVVDVRLLLCAIPKVATTTFIPEMVYDRVLGARVALHSAFLGDLLAKQLELRDYCKVAFVRNPWARVVSTCDSKICAPHPSFVRTLFIRYPGIWHRMPFEDFVEWLCGSEDGKDAVADRHWISQHRFLYSGGVQLVDRVARLESLDREFQRICEDLGREPVRLRNRSLKTTAGGSSYRHYYNDHTVSLVARRYAEDTQRFGYEF